MKDYRLSEIKEICKNQHRCDDCEFFEICEGNSYPYEHNIDPRDMIELPCKLPYMNGCGRKKYLVIYRRKDGVIDWSNGNSEAEADAFLSKLKGGNNGD